MRRISPNNPVRRRLFSADHDDASTENFINLAHESMAADQEQKKLRWNFDFKNDIPLKGDIEWYRNGPDGWIGIKPETKETCIENDDAEPEGPLLQMKNENEPSDSDPLLQMRNENEVTPRSNKNKSATLLRKRRNDVESLNKTGVKRKVSFD